MTPLVLLPGMNCSTRLWAALDLTVPPLHPAWRGATMEEQVTALLDTLPERFALAGLSLGGIVAMALAARAPQRVERLCLMSTNARPPLPEQIAGWRESLAQLDAGATARDVQRLALPGLLGDEPDADLVETTLAMADDVGEATLARQLAAQQTRVDLRPGLAGVAVPTLVLCGEEDRLCPVDRHVEIAGGLPQARLTRLPGAGHLLPLERPDVVSAALNEWLSRPPAR